jgi:hypothetical protein
MRIAQFTHIASLALLSFLSSGCTERSEAATRRDRTQPAKPIEKIKTFKVFGVHLGMPVSEARKVLIAEGFSRFADKTPPAGPGFFWDAYYRREETNDTLELAYTVNRSGVPVVSLLYAPESFGDISLDQALARVRQRYGPQTQTVDHVRYKDYWWTGNSTFIDKQQFYNSMTCFDNRRCANEGSPLDMCRVDKVLKYPTMNVGFNTNKPRDLVAYITIVDFGAPHDLLFVRGRKSMIRRPGICPRPVA